MRDYVVLLLMALALLLVSSDMASGSAAKLEMPQNLNQPAQMEPFSGRALRTGEMADEASDLSDEERSFADITKKLGTGMKAWAQNKKLAAFVKYESMFTDTARTMDKFFKRNISPDDVFKYLKLYKKSRRWVGREDWSPELRLWREYHNAWTKKYPTWSSKVNLDWLSDPKRFFSGLD